MCAYMYVYCSMYMYTILCMCVCLRVTGVVRLWECGVQPRHLYTEPTAA